MSEGKETAMSKLGVEICRRIGSVFTEPTTTPVALDTMVHELSNAAKHGSKVFVYGVGREGLMMKGLCMRLAHLGLSAHCIFDMTTPPISSSDLLLVSAGPGFFSTVEALCKIAKNNGGRVVYVTAQAESSAALECGDVIVHVPAQTMANDGGDSMKREVLPMGSLYEGAMFVLFEMVIYRLGECLEQSPQLIRSRHTNLE